MPSLGNDLARIRKEQNLNLDDIQRATKIPKRILNSIEDDSIFSDFEENPTYIRSYVRSYAKALSIDEQQIVFALNKVQKGDYKGSLQQLLEDGKRQTFQLDEDTTDTEEDNGDEDEMIHDHTPESSETKEVEPTTQGDSAGNAKRRKSESPSVHSVDWADMGRRFQPLESTKSKVWIGIATILIIAAVAGYVYFYEFNGINFSNDDSQTGAVSEATSEAEAPSDSLQLNIVPPADSDSNALPEKMNEEQTAAESLTTLPDTLSMVVYAAYDKLEPVRVYTDIMDGINPYWIEHGDAVRFQFVNEIRIRGQFSRMELLFNGHAIPDFGEEFYNPDTRLLEIERRFFEGDSTWLQSPPDSLAIDAPPPTNIQNRTSL